MQDPGSQDIVSDDGAQPNEDSVAEKSPADEPEGENLDDEPVLDVSGKTWELSLFDSSKNSIRGLYLYRNVFNLIPRALGGLERLKTLKFFANEINLFPSEAENLVELECLQVKISSPGLSGLPLHKLKALKELELCKVPPRPSSFPILSEVAGLTSLTKLSFCHFSIRYLPPEISCLSKLEYLDLSFNKLKSLPNEVTFLSALKSLKVANNKLVELPLGLSCLQRLEILDLSNNRLTSLGSLNLASMHTLQKLNLQYNKLLDYCQIPSWICCNLEGNGKDTSNDEFISSSVEVDAFDAAIKKVDASSSCNGSSGTSSSMLSEVSSNGRCSASRRTRKGSNWRDCLQQRARQERLNNSRKLRVEDHDQIMTTEVAMKRKPCELHVVASDSIAECASNIVKDIDEENTRRVAKEISSSKGPSGDNCSCIDFDGQDEDSSSEVSINISKPKRHSDRDLDNPKPSKSRRPFPDHSNLSCKYSSISFCSIDDRLPDGFYDAGRDRPFMPLENYEQALCLDSREVILVDRERDEELDAILLSAQALVSRFKQTSGSVEDRDHDAVDNLRVASWLALFVSSCFGGSDRSSIIEKARKSVSGSNYQKPFVCTCSSGNSDDNRTPIKHASATSDCNFIELCEKSLRFIKETRNSNIVPIGTLRFGVCRHRAVLMKYLCDRVEPPIPCELVRGYLDFMPHAWNAIIAKKGDSVVRMVVDACHPTDIREETDPEYFCRYIPLSRLHDPLDSKMIDDLNCSLPSLSSRDEVEKKAQTSLIQCKFGSVEAAAKVRTLEACEESVEDVRNFEYTCLGELRMLRVLNKHPCIVEIYGHQISSKWVSPLNGSKEYRLLQSAIVMEYIKGGSLKSYMENLSKDGKKHVPMELALFIARDVACALVELHSKHIIHRDIKSENILVDLDNKRADGSPIVKLCDFDRAVPLRSFLHTCCLAHVGIPPPDVCVGTPRWMAPEVLQAMHRRKLYGLEVDIWSYGCLLLELLTLQVPYAGLPDSEIHGLLQRGKRPRLADELESLRSSDERQTSRLSSSSECPEGEQETMRLLVDIFHQCTKGDPGDRPNARHIYDMLHAHSISLTNSTS
ncbi:PREDICTED: uncharacterized protein LOC104598673 [Nelumbo nucifera]|uniref:Uncharacterized protein LOC104598673 n=2 Tax=Nelumbo nucifera TaxID=4432 RepID=A0A1U7ZXC2_NELNU|nr:PREDICTED: uncharacterized protein LOC104598673 [Nelumbo nucifera]DAD47948.1 TPA_asm: hypothetical protein HUJ06_017885 [Nelumbo nucifera]